MINLLFIAVASMLLVSLTCPIHAAPPSKATQLAEAMPQADATPEENGAPDKAAQPDPKAAQSLQVLLAAISANDYAQFIMAVGEEVKAMMTQEIFDRVVANFAPRLNKGYDALYLGELKKSGQKVYLWKLVFQDEGDDAVATVSLKGDQVGGFFLF